MRPVARGTDGPLRPTTAIPSRVVALSKVAWGEPPASPALARAETHVWAIDVDAQQPRLSQLAALLSPDESARGGRIRDPETRGRFIAGRGILRTLLGRYCGLTPESIRFDYGEAGKPSLAPSVSMNGLRFNASGSGALALVALRRDFDVGVDIEQFRELPLPAARKGARFFESWVGNEAVVKSLGLGLGRSFDRLGLPDRAGDGSRKVLVHDTGRASAVWMIELVAPRPGYAAALASTASIDGLRCWTF